MKSFVHDTAAVRVVFGVGSLGQLAEESARLGQRVLLVVDEAAKDLADEVAGDLATRLADRIDEVVMHVPVDVGRAAVQRAVGADVVVSIGGGSATGLAKIVARDTGLPILAVPTTYAGSEMTPIWGETAGARKTTGKDPKVLPRAVIYDPALTVSLPGPASAASGMNALAHCVEGLYAAGASPATSVLAAEGVRALASALPQVVDDPRNLDARGDALYGAWLAGWVLGTAGMGVHHKICHVLGGTFELPHAGVHAAVLPYATAFNAPYAPEAMKRLADALGSSNPALGLWDLARRIGAPTSLAEIGFRDRDADEAADVVVSATFDNPRPVERDGIRELLLAAHRGVRPA